MRPILVLAALLAGVPMLAPATADAVVDEASGGLVCHEVGASWFDQWCYQKPDPKEGGGSSEAEEVTAKKLPTRGYEVVIIPTASVPKLQCGDEGVVCPHRGGNRTPRNTDRDGKPDPNDRWDKGHPSCNRSGPDREGVCQPLHDSKAANRAKRLWAQEKERVQICRFLEGNLTKFRRWTREVEETGMVDGEPPAMDSSTRGSYVAELQGLISTELRRLVAHDCDLNPVT